MPCIQFRNGVKSGQQYELLGSQTTFGRDQFCTVVIPVHSISRQHARIHCDEGGAYTIEDLGSLNGTFVNGRRVDRPMELHDGDMIALYETQMAFFEKAPERGVSPTATAPIPKGSSSAAPIPSQVASTPVADDSPSRNKLRAMLDMTRSLGRSLAVQDSLSTILDSAFEIFPEADRGFILLAEAGTRHLSIGASKRRGMDDAATTMGPLNPAIAEKVMRDGQGVLFSDGSADDSVFASAVSSAMTVPLIGPTRKPLGIVHLETKHPEHHFTQDDLEVLISVATVAGQAVEHAQMHEAQLRLDRRDRELSTAKEVQRHFLPQSRPNATGYCFYDYYCAADDVGGDYFGYLELDDGRLAIAVGDVSGKGVSAALLMARLCSEVRYCLATSTDPVTAVCQLNDSLADPTLAIGDRFVTFLLCVLDPVQHELIVVNAGHMPPLCRRAVSGEVEPLGADEAGPPLGFQFRNHYSAFITQLAPGDMVLLYTDGVSEATNQADQIFGIARIGESLAKGPPQAARMGQALLEEVRDYLEATPQDDDICILCFQRES